MGGKALKSVVTRRCDRKEFDSVSSELINKLKQHFNNVEIPLFYSTKESFGDIDIVISMDGFNKNMREFIESEFKPNEIFHNDSAWSFDYKEIQVDLITASDDNFSSMANYLNFNDLGNLIGKIAHSFGIKYGQQGMWLEHYFKGLNIGRVYISKDTKKIFEFLDLSFDRYLNGFDTLEEIFEYVSNSKYFDWYSYQLDQLNRVDRERNLKRKNYMLFLDWIDKHVRDDDHINTIKLTENELIKLIDDTFPEANVIGEIRRLEYEECKKLYISSKFNGKMVMDQFGLVGKELGDALTGFKKYIEEDFSDNYDQLLLNNTSGHIKYLFKIYLEKHK